MWIEAEKCKNKNKGIVCPWFMQIEDLAEEKTAAPKATVSSNVLCCTLELNNVIQKKSTAGGPAL